jgi:spermidine synthase
LSLKLKNLLIGFWLVAFPAILFAQTPVPVTVYEKNSLYQTIIVAEEPLKQERYLYSNKRGFAQGGISLQAPEKLLLDYLQTSLLGLVFLDREPRDILFVGLGAGSLPAYMARLYPSALIDVVEIDPEMPEVAERFFFFKPGKNMKMHLNDGRVFIKRTKRKYDLIFLDAYRSDSIPFHLTTVEFLKEVKAILRENGVVVANIVTPVFNKLFPAMVRTYQTVFPGLFIYGGEKPSSLVFIAGPGGAGWRDETIVTRVRAIQAAGKLEVDLPRLLQTRLYLSPASFSKAEVLTDDFAPAALYQAEKNK